MFTLEVVKTLVIFFLIGYSLLLVPIVIIFKNTASSSCFYMKQIQNSYNLKLYLMIIFFLMSGLPLTNVFLLKWYCLVSILSIGNFYTLLIFIILNVITVLFYYYTFNKIIVSINATSGHFNFKKPNTYLLYIFSGFGVYYNIFGFLFINYLMCIL